MTARARSRRMSASTAALAGLAAAGTVAMVLIAPDAKAGSAPAIVQRAGQHGAHHIVVTDAGHRARAQLTRPAASVSN